MCLIFSTWITKHFLIDLNIFEKSELAASCSHVGASLCILILTVRSGLTPWAAVLPQHDELAIFDWCFGGHLGGGDVFLTQWEHLWSFLSEESMRTFLWRHHQSTAISSAAQQITCGQTSDSKINSHGLSCWQMRHKTSSSSLENVTLNILFRT